MQNFFDQVIPFLAINPKIFALCLQAFCIGVLGAILSNAATEFTADSSITDFKIKNFWSYTKFAILGGICGTLAQLIEGSDKVLIIQALTIGATWPKVVSRIKKQGDIKDFINSGTEVPVTKDPK